MREGYWVRGVDIKEHEFAPPLGPPTPRKLGGTGGGGAGGQTDEFLLLDLRKPENCQKALTVNGRPSTSPSTGSGQCLEIKAISKLHPKHDAQAINYLTATGFRLAILLNPSTSSGHRFGADSLQHQRIVK